MLRYPLLHPPLLRALAAAGHGSRVLIADANYAHATNVHPRADLVHLNLRPGLIRVDDILETLVTAIPIEAATVMRPDDGPAPDCWRDYQRLLGAEPALVDVPRAEFYAACTQPSLAVCVASGDDRYYANVLLTVGAVPPS